MTIYLTIITTVLVLTQIVRITQNHISLKRQEAEIKRSIEWVGREYPQKEDFQNQREVMRLLRAKLESEETK